MSNASEITKAILLVGGKGTRLAPLTNQIPKPMLKIAGAPVTEHQILKARAAGITEIVLATSYLSEVFKPHFGDGSRFGLKIHYSLEEVPLGTGGAIATGAAQLELSKEESIFIFNGDVLSAHDLRAQSAMHHERKAEVTLHLTEVEDARSYGCVPIAADSRVLEFLEKMENPIAKTINAGCYIFNNAAISSIPQGEVISVERDTFPKLLKDGALLYGYRDSSYWIDMGTPNSMIAASKDLVISPELSVATRGSNREALIEEGCEISPTAEVNGGSYVEMGAKIADGTQVSGTIIGAGAQIGSNVKIKNSYIAAGSRVVDGSNLDGEIFGF